MWSDRVSRLVGPSIQLPGRIWIACLGAAMGALFGEVVAAMNGDDPGLMLIALLFGLPVGALLLTIRHRNLLIAGVLATGALLPVSAEAYHAAGTSSTAALAVLWVPYLGVPVALVLAACDHFLVRRRVRAAPRRSTLSENAPRLFDDHDEWDA